MWEGQRDFSQRLAQGSVWQWALPCAGCGRHRSSKAAARTELAGLGPLVPSHLAELALCHDATHLSVVRPGSWLPDFFKSRNTDLLI